MGAHVDTVGSVAADVPHEALEYEAGLPSAALEVSCATVHSARDNSLRDGEHTCVSAKPHERRRENARTRVQELASGSRRDAAEDGAAGRAIDLSHAEPRRRGVPGSGSGGGQREPRSSRAWMEPLSARLPLSNAPISDT